MNKKLKKSIKIVVSFIPAILLLMLFLFDKIYYFTNDDVLMNDIARGYEIGKPDIHLIFINSTFGHITKFLYGLSKNVNWYAILYLLLILICVYILFYIAKKYISFWMGFFVAIAIEGICVYLFTFTVLSFICVCSSIILLVDVLTNNNNKNYQKYFLIVMGTIVFCFGFILRKNAAMAALVIMTPLIIFSVKKVINYKTLIISICLVAIGILSVSLINHISYDSEFWSKYNEYNHLRAQVMDFPIPSYNKNKEFYKNNNLSKNDIGCLRDWCFGDKEVFSPKVLKRIIKKTPFSTKYNTNPIKFRVTDYSTSNILLSYLYIVYFVICSILFMVFGKKNRFYYGSQIFVTILVCSCYFVQNRVLARVLIPTILISLIASSYYWIRKKRQNIIKGKNRIRKLTLVGFALVLIVNTIFLYYLTFSRADSTRDYYGNTSDNVKEYVRKNPDILFLTKFKSFLFCNSSVNKMIDKEIYPNIMQTGDPYMYNNVYYIQMEMLGVEDKYKNRLLMNLIERKNTFMIGEDIKKDKNVKRVYQFLKEHSKSNIELKVTDKIKGTKVFVYKFSKK